jgi:phosphatidate cytidylyltransferase
MNLAVESANANLLTRLATAVVMVPLIFAMLYLLPPVVFYGLVLVATVVGGLEFFRMTHPEDKVAQWVGIAVCLAVSLGLYFGAHDERVLLSMLGLVPLTAILVPLWRLGDINTAAIRICAGAFGPMYLSSLTLLALFLKERGAEGAGWILFTLTIGWLADTFGYFFGRFLGKHKLYPAVSPKKTVEGAVGALLGAVAGAFLAKFVWLRSLNLTHGVILALVAGAIGQMGDLGESLLKRSTNIKDSGTIVPGHGGILDRVDAVLLASTLVYLYTRIAL